MQLDNSIIPTFKTFCFILSHRISYTKILSFNYTIGQMMIIVELVWHTLALRLTNKTTLDLPIMLFIEIRFLHRYILVLAKPEGVCFWVWVITLFCLCIYTFLPWHKAKWPLFSKSGKQFINFCTVGWIMYISVYVVNIISV